ncbi:MAG: RNA-binding protein [Treponema sp.]|uniref:RNA recognition motif-containing protein n=1 Tax=Treponema rectale TaxID=744512 RepID=A0A840S658_9SPIR|nr:RNA-binding protein [Treponema rectale]MBB5218009.1 RNA recognition motif-containing protein [Treponema rectale]MBO6176522.1 RNA-binding protein [Treponema sp.]QOS40276.1 RNA-binding protein [Treponema rectale]
MAKKVYAGNLNFITTEESLNAAFSKFGQVNSAVLIKDRDTNQSKGFGFVEFENDEDADRAIAAMNGKEFDGRKIRVSVAEEKKRRSF